MLFWAWIFREYVEQWPNLLKLIFFSFLMLSPFCYLAGSSVPSRKSYWIRQTELAPIYSQVHHSGWEKKFCAENHWPFLWLQVLLRRELWGTALLVIRQGDWGKEALEKTVYAMLVILILISHLVKTRSNHWTRPQSLVVFLNNGLAMGTRCLQMQTTLGCSFQWIWMWRWRPPYWELVFSL